MSYTAPDPQHRGQRPAAPPDRPAVAASTNPGGSPILALLRHRVEHPEAADDDQLRTAVEQALSGVTPSFTPIPELLLLLDLPDVAPPAAEAVPPLPRDLPPGLLTAVALAAALPTAAEAVHAPDLRPAVAALVTIALTTPPEPRSQKESYQLARAARNVLGTELVAFRNEVLDAGSTNDPALSAAALRVLTRVYVLRRWLLETTWPARVTCWRTLDRITEATYWPPDAVTLTRQEERLRRYEFRRWPSPDPS